MSMAATASSCAASSVFTDAASLSWSPPGESSPTDRCRTRRMTLPAASRMDRTDGISSASLTGRPMLAKHVMVAAVPAVRVVTAPRGTRGTAWACAVETGLGHVNNAEPARRAEAQPPPDVKQDMV